MADHFHYTRVYDGMQGSFGEMRAELFPIKD